MFAQAYDNPIPGFETKTVGNLRLFEAVPETELNLDDFNKGDFAKVPPLTARSVWSQSLTAEFHCRRPARSALHPAANGSLPDTGRTSCRTARLHVLPHFEAVPRLTLHSGVPASGWRRSARWRTPAPYLRSRRD